MFVNKHFAVCISQKVKGVVTRNLRDTAFQEKINPFMAEADII